MFSLVCPSPNRLTFKSFCKAYKFSKAVIEQKAKWTSGMMLAIAVAHLRFTCSEVWLKASLGKLKDINITVEMGTQNSSVAHPCIVIKQPQINDLKETLQP